MAVSFNRFTSTTYQLTGDLIEVPNLGATAVRRLRENNIHSTWQLIAYFLDSGRDQAIFQDFLNSVDAPASHTAAIARAIAKRVADVGIKVEVALPAHVVQSSRITDDKMDVFLRRVFTGKLEHDFEGLGMGKPGKPSGSVSNLAAAGIANTDMLFAAFLKKFDGPIDASSATKAAEFYTELKDKQRYGVAPGYSATIVDAIKAQLDIGIDQTEQRRVAPEGIAEEPEPPATEERVRRRPAVAPPAQPASAAPASAAPTRAAPPAKKGNDDGAAGILLVMVGVAFAAYYGYCAMASQSRELVMY